MESKTWAYVVRQGVKQDSEHCCTFPEQIADFLNNPATTMDDYENEKNVFLQNNKCGKTFKPCDVPPPPITASCDCCDKYVSEGVMYGCSEHNIHLCNDCNSKTPKEMKDFFDRFNHGSIESLCMDFEYAQHDRISFIEMLKDPDSLMSKEFGEEKRLNELAKWETGEIRTTCFGSILF